MTRADVIRDLAHRGGIPQIEASHFMEIFLSKLSAYLVEGDTLSLTGLGSFTLIRIFHETGNWSKCINRHPLRIRVFRI